MFLSSTFIYGVERPIYNEPSANPCLRNPCGPYSNCRVVGQTSACSCLPNYIGRPPQCRPECTIDSECPANLACINERCKDPCVGSCGLSTVCTVVNHSPVCTCQYLFTGDPFSGCYPVPSKNFPIQIVVVFVESAARLNKFAIHLSTTFYIFNKGISSIKCFNRNESDSLLL